MEKEIPTQESLEKMVNTIKTMDYKDQHAYLDKLKEVAKQAHSHNESLNNYANLDDSKRNAIDRFDYNSLTILLKYLVDFENMAIITDQNNLEHLQYVPSVGHVDKIRCPLLNFESQMYYGVCDNGFLMFYDLNMGKLVEFLTEKVQTVANPKLCSEVTK
jgi:hypothetical protein